MKKHHTFDLSIVALSILTAFLAPSFVAMEGQCPAGVSAPYVTASVSSDTLSASAGTRLPLSLSLANESDQQITGGSVYLAVFHDATGALIYNSVAKSGVSLAPYQSATSSIVWNIPANLYGDVYRFRPFFTIDGVALRGTMVSTSTPFGNTAKLYIAGSKMGDIPVADRDLPEMADYSGGACKTGNDWASWAMAIGGLGVLALVLAHTRKKPQNP